MSSVFRQRRERSSLFHQFWQQLSSVSPTQAEESIPLRILVQLLVAIGIVATDLAADTTHSLWAIPISCIGAAWSWRQRRDRNITVKFLIAMGMLVALFAFFGNLLGSLNDTRLVLAELLIQLQVLHSFDLPRRKDLGYSMVIGLILLGVAATLSQTLAFAPLLILFLLISLPVLVLDYRSRLGLEPSATKTTQPSPKWQLLPTSTLSLPRLSFFFLIILSVGLLIFALMPRLPSYQVQQFPVSGGNNLEDRGFNNEQDRQVRNPGLVEQGEGQGEGEGTDRQGQGEGESNNQFYYGFAEQINQNRGGETTPNEMKPRVVMRLRSQAPGWIKMMAFDHYTGQGWEIKKDEPKQELNRPRRSYRFRVSTSSSQAETERIVQTYTIVSQLPNLIPVLPQAKDVYFPTKEIAVDPHGTIRSPGELMEGLTFSVVSQVPYRDRSELRTASTDYSDIGDHYLQVPPEIENRIRQKAESILAESDNPLDSHYEKALYLAQQIKQRYRLQSSLSLLESDQDLVESFLFDWEGGYPDHFSTTLTVMLRSLGIPARLATGFSSGEFNPFTGLYIIRNTDAFALTEVYFPEYGWFQFDPIPGHPLIPPSIEKSQTFGVIRQFWNWIAGWLPSPVVSLFNYLWTVIIGTLIAGVKTIWQFFTQGWVAALAGLMSLVLATFLGWLGWQQWQRWRYRRWMSRLAPTERIYQQMLQLLAQQGLGKQPAQTPFEYVETTATNLEPPQVEVVQEISQAYVRWRYGDYLPNLDYLQQVLQQLKRSFQRKRR